jgi:hypothetical protein
MDTQALELNSSPLPVPPSYEECVVAHGPRADYIVSPLAMAALFCWDEDDE